MFVWTSGFQNPLAHTHFNMFVDEWTSANESLGLHQSQRQRFDNSAMILIDNNGVTPDWGWNPFWSDSNVFNENGIARVIAELSQT